MVWQMWPYFSPSPGRRTPRALAKPNRWSTAGEAKDAPGERTSGEPMSSAMTVPAPTTWSPDQWLTVLPSPHLMCRRRARCGHGFVHYHGNRGRASPEQGRDLCLDTGQRRGRGVRCSTRYLPDRRHRPHLSGNRSRTHREPLRQVPAAYPKPEISNDYGLPVPRFRDLRLDVLGGGNFAGDLLLPAPLPRLPRGGHLGDGSSILLAFLGPFPGRLGQLGHRG